MMNTIAKKIGSIPCGMAASLRWLAGAAILYALSAIGANAQGTIPIALNQQFAFTACATTSSVCGTPLAGGFLYIFQVGTVATPQTAFQDSGLTLPLPWPVPLDSTGRIPMFYLANGSVHVRLTDANGIVQFDIPSMLVIGASSGGGGGGTIDPTTISSTGDIKFRATGETVVGWVKLNGQSIGSATSGATQRANADTQNLYIYLWNNCSSPSTNRRCPVAGGLGASGLADFNANKLLNLMDWRDRSPVGLDDMGNTAKGGLLTSNITSGGTDGPTTPNAQGGVANQAIAGTNLPAVPPTGTVTSNAMTTIGGSAIVLNSAGGVMLVGGLGSGSDGWADPGVAGSFGLWGSSLFTVAGSQFSATTSVSSTFTGNNLGSGTAMNVMDPFVLGTWYVKL